MAEEILNSAPEATLTVSEIVISELRIKVVDCRSNAALKEFQTSKVRISNGTKTFEREFDRKKDTAAINETSKIKGSMLALQKLGYESATTATAKDKLPKNYDDTWRGYYNAYWTARIPDFQNLESGDPSDAMMNYIIKEYNSHRATDSNGLLRLQIPNLFMDDKEVTVEVGFFNFPVVLERCNDDSRAESASVIRTTDTETTHTGFEIKLNSATTQTTSWKANFGWKIHNGEDSSEFKFSEEFKVKKDTAKFEKFKPEWVSGFYAEATTDSPHFVLFALQWCQPIYDLIEDPDPDGTTPGRSNDDTFINLKQGDSWIRGLHMHMPSVWGTGSGAYYGRRATTNESPQPRGKEHNGTDLYSGPDGNYNVFAVHAGATNKKNSSTYGYAVGLALQGSGHPSFYYAHLAAEAETKDWVMAGQKIGVADITQDAESSTKKFFSDVPYHLHFEFFKSAPNGTGVPGKSATHPRDKVEEFPGMTKPSGAKYNIPAATDPNAFMFLAINKLPLVFPCKSLFRSSDVALTASQTIADVQYNYKCIILNTKEVAEDKDAKKRSQPACYAYASFPYTNDRLKTNMNIQTPGLSPTTGLIRYVCPHIRNSPFEELKLQIKIHWLITNRTRFSPAIFSYATSEETTFNSFFDDDINITMDGKPGPNTKRAIRCLIRAHHYCANTDLTGDERALPKNNAKIDNDKIQAFLDKCLSDTALPTDDDHSIIRDFTTWFENDVDFSKMCWNA